MRPITNQQLDFCQRNCGAVIYCMLNRHDAMSAKGMYWGSQRQK